MWFLIKTTKTLLRFHENFVKVLMLTEFEWSLDKIWTEIITLTVRNYIRIDMRFRNSEIWNVKFIKSILAVMKKMERFSDREITFLINVIFKKQKTVSFINFKIQNVIDILNLIVIFSNNRLLRFLLLIR